MAALRNAAIGALRAAGVTNFAAANRHHAPDANRHWQYSASPDDFAGALGYHRSIGGEAQGPIQPTAVSDSSPVRSRQSSR
jgi:hypothetical protein